MNLSQVIKSTLFTTFVISPIFLTACSPVNFSHTQNSSPNAGATSTTPPAPVPPTCTPSVEAIVRPTKIIFIVDTSGSNAAGTYNVSPAGQTYYVAATDPQKNFRGGAIGDFFTRFEHKTNFSWSFATFAEDDAQAYIHSGSQPIFTQNTDLMSNAISEFYGARDYGNTPYKAALTLAYDSIASDPDLNSTAQPDYFVILLTDGMPTDYLDNRGVFQPSLIDRDIAALTALAPGRISLSTIYYSGASDPNAISLLQGIAAEGAGQFANVANISNFKIDDVIPGVSSSCSP